MDIVCLSSDHWDAPLWTNKQHVMSRLAGAGHRVLYVDPLTGLATLWRGRKTTPYRRMDWFRWTHQRMRNLWVHSALGFPWSRVSGVDRFVNPWLRLLVLKHVVKRLGFLSPVLWIYHPSDVFLVGRLGEEVVAYDCVDEIAAWTGDPHLCRTIQQNERRLLELADVVFTTARPLYEARKRENANTYLVENAADYAHFSRAQESGAIPADVAAIPRPIVGFVGAIRQRKVDVQLLAEVARSCPHWSLVLIGPVCETQVKLRLSVLPNVHLLGYREYQTLPDYLRAFDVCMIPYRVDNEYIRNVFPMKFFEFLATGKPVVTTGLPSLEKYGDVVAIAHSPQQFIEGVKRGISGAGAERDVMARMTLAKENSWEKRIGQMVMLVEEQRGKTKPHLAHYSGSGLNVRRSSAEATKR